MTAPVASSPTKGGVTVASAGDDPHFQLDTGVGDSGSADLRIRMPSGRQIGNSKGDWLTDWLTLLANRP